MVLHHPTHCSGVTDGRLQKDSVAIEELVEGVANRISSFPDPDCLHHAGVPQLTQAQLSVKQLTRVQQTQH